MAVAPGRYRLGPDRGRIVVKTFRDGLAAPPGHDREAGFAATRFERAGEDGGTMDGTVTLRGLARPLRVRVSQVGPGMRSPLRK